MTTENKRQGWRPTFEATLTMVAMAVAMVVGVCIGASAAYNVDFDARNACIKGEQHRRCCSCTQEELGRCGR